MTDTLCTAQSSGSTTEDYGRLLAPFRKSSYRIALWQLGSTMVMFIGAVWAMGLSLSVGYWLTLLLAIPTGGLLVRLFIFQHDCGHGSFFHSRRANRTVGMLLGVLTFTPYEDWRYAHALHHASHGDLDRRGNGDVRTLTIAEYQSKSWWGKLGYRLYRHPLVMFGVFPTLLFLIRFRTALGIEKHLKRQRRSVWWNNLGIAAAIALGVWLAGVWTLVLVWLPIIIVAATVGVWMFYVQHQFDPAYWEHHEQWSRLDAALKGSSYYRLPKVLQWFTGSIGLHHIHHLDSRIPNYRLQQCLDANRELLDIPALTLGHSLRCARLKLWDERTEQLVGFDAPAVKATAGMQAQPA